MSNQAPSVNPVIRAHAQLAANRHSLPYACERRPNGKWDIFPASPSDFLAGTLTIVYPL